MTEAELVVWIQKCVDGLAYVPPEAKSQRIAHLMALAYTRGYQEGQREAGRKKEGKK